MLKTNKDLEELKRAEVRQADLEMLRLASDNLEELKGLPANLRSKANEILYTK